MISLPCTHSSFEAAHPDEAEAAAALEQNRQALHIRRTGSLDGFTASRDWPCLGVLEIVDRHGPQWVVECTACGWATTIRSPERQRAERTLDEALEAAKW